jgi:polysaccharide export outer membrane protein
MLACLFVTMSSLIEGCALPQSAPLMKQVQEADKQSRIVLTPVTPEVAAASLQPATASFPAAYLQAKPVDYTTFTPGDGIDVVVWERDGLGVYPATSNGASDLGAFTVDVNGDLELPFVGKLHVAGDTPNEARMLLLRRLRGIVIASDVRFALTGQHGALVTIQGDVTKAGVYPIGPGMLRLSAVLSLAAPDQTNPEQTLVTVRRDGVSSSVRLNDVYRDAAQDIALRPGDSIVVSPLHEYVTVLGAAGAQGRVPISKRNYSVLDALADSRGAADASADIRALFLIRAQASHGAAQSDTRPQVYGFDLRRPEEMALAKQFAVHDGDSIFISDAPFAQVQKVLSSLTATLGTARSVSALSQ